MASQLGQQGRQRIQAPRGVTLVELLVVMTVLGILITLLLPAIQAVRERARSVQCLNNQRQIGIALHNFEGARGGLPPGSESRSFPANPLHAHTFYRWSALAHLLPYLERAATYQALDLNYPLYGVNFAPDPRHQPAIGQLIEEFLCPSDHGQAVSETFGPTNYAANAGTGAQGGSPFQTDGIFYVNSATRVAEIRDGLSKTVVFAESLLGNRAGEAVTPVGTRPEAGRNYVFSFATPLTVSACSSSSVFNFTDPRGFAWASGEFRCALYNHHATPNSPELDCVAALTLGDVSVRYAPYGWRAARSAHPGSVNVLLGDGSARAVVDSVDAAVWQAASTRAGAETLPGGW